MPVWTLKTLQSDDPKEHTRYLQELVLYLKYITEHLDEANVPLLKDVNENLKALENGNSGEVPLQIKSGMIAGFEIDEESLYVGKKSLGDSQDGVYISPYGIDYSSGAKKIMLTDGLILSNEVETDIFKAKDGKISFFGAEGQEQAEWGLTVDTMAANTTMCAAAIYAVVQQLANFGLFRFEDE